MKRRTALTVAGLFGLIWGLNTSLFVSGHESGATKLLAHRGIHQVYTGGVPDNNTCTAAPIKPPTHPFLENTLPSMRAAFDAGADVVEIDVHLTPDGQFAVFHDWRLECRTDGQGVTHEMPMADLKALDVGFGYAVDGDPVFPFRGRGIGMMPSLEEVFDAFPSRQFLVNFKSRRSDEGNAFAALLNENPTWRTQIFGVYGGAVPTRAALAKVPELRGYDRRSAMACLLKYEAIGWLGIVPAACQNTIVVVPVNVAPFLWGWPARFQQRMRAGGSEIILIGPYKRGGFSAGIDSVAQLKTVPEGFAGYVWTDRIEVIGPRAPANNRPHAKDAGSP